jgi:hypothetical protein
VTQFLADPIYNPDLVGFVDCETKLGPGVSMSSFLGSYGNRASIDYIPDQPTRHKIARNLYLHAEIIRQFTGLEEFREYSLVIAESISPEADGSYSGYLQDNDENALSTGRAVVYQLFDAAGNMAHNKIFDLAVFWKDSIPFGKLHLDYDTYNPDGSFASSIVLFVPRITEDTIPSTVPGKDPVSAWQINDPIKEVNTYFNGYLQTKGDLVEILPLK